MKRIRIQIGDVFAVPVDEHSKRYFQFVAIDSTQLSSDVIRAFSDPYPLDAEPELGQVVAGSVQFYAHVVIAWGLKMELWERAGHVADVGNLNVLFRGTNDYGTKVGEEPVKVSDKWYVWHINGERMDVGRLTGEYREAYIGLVINPNGILDLMRGKKYPPYYPE